MYKKIYQNGGYCIMTKVNKHFVMEVYDIDGKLCKKTQIMPTKIVGIRSANDYIKMLLELGYEKIG